MPKCSSCGADVPEGTKFCGECGQPMAAPQKADAETTFYQDERVTITNTRATIAGKLFAMAQITSVQAVKKTPNRLWPIALVGFGGLFFLVGLFMLIMGDPSGLACTMGGGAAAVLLGGLWLFAAKPTYAVVIGSSSGETRALVTPKEDYAKTVAGALQEAIVKRG